MQNRAEICRALSGVLADVKSYTDLAFHPQRERLLFSELESRLKEEQNRPQAVAELLDGILEQSRRLLEQMNAAGCTCTVCGSVVRFLPPSPYRRVMRSYYGYRENGARFLFEEGGKDRCPVCKATQEIRFLLGFLEDVRSEEDETLKVCCMEEDREETLALVNSVRGYAAQRTDMEYIGERGKADVVICAGILEQADSEAEVFGKIKELLADNGLCVLMLSALGEEMPDTRETVTGDEAYSWKTFGLEKVKRQYTKSGLIAACEENGFAVSAADRSWFGSEYYEQYGFGDPAELFMLTLETDRGF